MQHRRDATIAVAAILEGERRDVGGQRRFIIRGLGDLALRGTMLTQDLARPSLGHTQFLGDMIHASAATGGAQMAQLRGSRETNQIQRLLFLPAKETWCKRSTIINIQDVFFGRERRGR